MLRNRQKIYVSERLFLGLNEIIKLKSFLLDVEVITSTFTDEL